ncbi:retinal-binding protein, partial [Trichonephila clavata]
MLKKNLEFRRIAQIDTILTDYKTPEVCDKYISQNFIGYDKEGCPVYFSALGNFDQKGVFKSANKIDIFKCCIQMIEGSKEKMKLQSKKLDKPVTQCIYIYDMDNLTLAKATHKHTDSFLMGIELFLLAVGMFLDNYPEILKCVYVLNASSYFTLVFPLVKAILSGSILNKITIFGKDGYKEELLKVIDAATLPAFLGGKKTDPDGNPRCETY